MAPFEASPRPTKRRRTITPSASKDIPSEVTRPPVPFSTRAFRAVKDVLLRKGAIEDDSADGEDELAATPSQDRAIGGRWKSVSTPEVGKMASPQNEEKNEETRAIGTSGTSWPMRNGTGITTPSETTRRTRAQHENTGNDDEEVSQMPSKTTTQFDGAGPNGKRKRYRTEAQGSCDGERMDEDRIQSSAQRKPKRNIRMNESGPAVAVRSPQNSSPPNGTPRSKRQKIMESQAAETVTDGRKESARAKPISARLAASPRQLRNQQRHKPNNEELELGFKAIGTQNRTEDVVQEASNPSTRTNDNLTRIATNSISKPIKTSKKHPQTFPSKYTANASVVSQTRENPLDDVSNGVLQEEAIDSLHKVLDLTSTEDLQSFKDSILKRLTGHRRLPLVNLESEYQKVHQIVEQTVLAGEGNSMLLIGSRGCAKTALIETVVADLSTAYAQNFHVLRLNGFIHTDDKLALREIWRQLGRDMEVEDDATAGRTNYADTLSSLLALLAHNPKEEPDAEAPSIAKSVIFILDEFDLFASHPRQTLLYNLFDVAQSRNAPIAVLGLTTKINVVESLEKRVKSRFGQRYVHLSLPHTFAAFSSICKSVLIPSPPDLPGSISRKGAEFRRRMAVIEDLHAAWETYVNHLFNAPEFLLYLCSIYATTKSVPTFLSSCLYPISNLSSTNIPTSELFQSPWATLRQPDSKLHLLASLSDLALSLLIAAARLDIILSTDLCNFEMVYEEYVNLASRVKIQTSASGQLAVGGGGGRVWGRGVAKGEWERLIALELVLPATGGAMAGRGRGEQGRMWRVDVGLEEIGACVKMGPVMARWCREI